MRLASYRHRGNASYGIVVQDGIIDLAGRTGARSLRELLERQLVAGCGRYAGLAADVPLAQIEWLPPVPDADRIMCAGINYRSHAAETGRDLPANPSMFLRHRASLVGHGQPVRKPRASDHYDYEGELALVIGRAGRHIALADALDHVAGYTCLNDGSVRDYQKISVGNGKNFEASGACGPWMVTVDEIPDPARLALETRLNGQVVQHSGTDLLIYSIPHIISYYSTICTLMPGDIITTGTPDGVGSQRKPPLWMRAGDRIEVEISAIGTLANPVLDEG